MLSQNAYFRSRYTWVEQWLGYLGLNPYNCTTDNPVSYFSHWATAAYIIGNISVYKILSRYDIADIIPCAIENTLCWLCTWSLSEQVGFLSHRQCSICKKWSSDIPVGTPDWDCRTNHWNLRRTSFRVIQYIVYTKQPIESI